MWLDSTEGQEELWYFSVVQIPWAQHDQHAHSGWSVCRGCRCRGPVQVNYEAAKSVNKSLFNASYLDMWSGILDQWNHLILRTFLFGNVLGQNLDPESKPLPFPIKFPPILNSKCMTSWFPLKPATWFQAQNDGRILLPATECLVLDEALMGGHYADRRDVLSCSQGAPSVSHRDVVSPYQCESSSPDSNALFPYLIVWKMYLWQHV